MRRENYRDMVGADRLNNSSKLLRANRIKLSSWFICYQHKRSVNDRLGYGNTLTFAARQISELYPSLRVNPSYLHRPKNSRSDGLLREAVGQHQRKRNVTKHCQIFDHAGILRDGAHPTSKPIQITGLEASNFLSKAPDLTKIWLQGAKHKFNERGFACARLAFYKIQSAWLNCQVKWLKNSRTSQVRETNVLKFNR